MSLRDEIARALYSEEWKEEAPDALEGGDTFWHRQADRILAIPRIAAALEAAEKRKAHNEKHRLIREECDEALKRLAPSISTHSDPE